MLNVVQMVGSYYEWQVGKRHNIKPHKPLSFRLTCLRFILTFLLSANSGTLDRTTEVECMGEEYKYEVAMVIDDSELDNLVAKATIESALFAKKVYSHSSAKSALEFLTNLGKAKSPLSFYPQIIFVDLIMPDTDGFQFLDRYKPLESNHALQTKIVVLTSSDLPENKVKVKAIDPHIEYIQKPLSPEKLKAL